jgi:IS1 family transposase
MINISCRKCGSTDIRKNGLTNGGAQKYHCKACKFYGTLVTQEEKQKKKEELIEKLLYERVSQRGIARTVRVSRNRVISLIKKKEIQPVASDIVTSEERPVVEMDEVWSFVGAKKCRIWIWLAMNRHTRQIVGAAFGDHSDMTCIELWRSLPPDYRKRAVIYTDFWESYANILPSKRHRAVGKKTGQTAHIERFNNTLRQRCPAMVRKTLSFSKDEAMHEKRIRIFIDYYNKSLSV